MKNYLRILKNKVKPLFHTLLIITVLFSFARQTYGQEKLSVSIGFGVPELLNAGVRFQSNQTQIGFSIGTMPLGSSEKIISISGDLYFHFGGVSKLSNRRPWYGQIGLNYLRDETERLIDKYVYLNTRVGKELNISRKVGIGIGVGALFQLANEEIRKEPRSGWLNLDLEFPVIPSLGLGIFYKI